MCVASLLVDILLAECVRLQTRDSRRSFRLLTCHSQLPSTEEIQFHKMFDNTFPNACSHSLQPNTFSFDFYYGDYANNNFMSMSCVRFVKNYTKFCHVHAAPYPMIAKSDFEAFYTIVTTTPTFELVNLYISYICLLAVVYTVYQVSASWA